ncbi:MAG: hypothetical protein MAG794_01357 [Gammaproteobacteria bacterium]|nr:hypothetical protein [Gammaproteobacteria bacterium]
MVRKRPIDLGKDHIGDTVGADGNDRFAVMCQPA